MKRRKLDILHEIQFSMQTSETSKISSESVGGRSIISEIDPQTISIPSQTSLMQESVPSTCNTALDFKYLSSKFQEKAVQVNLKPYYRSKGIMAKQHGIHVATSPFMQPSQCASTSPFKEVDLLHVKKLYLTAETEDQEDNDATFSSQPSTSGSFYEPGSSSSISTTFDEELQNERFMGMMRTGTIMAIEKGPKLLGIPKQSYFLVKLLTESIHVPTIDILNTLKKIKLNESQSNVSRIFKQTIPLIAGKMQELTICPDPSRICLHIPIPFRARYSKVVSSIDCLEIEIEKPTNAVHQSLTWSQYKGCNTLKYLVSCVE